MRHDPSTCDCEERKVRNLFGKEEDGSLREYYGCPERLLTPEVMEWIGLWIEWKWFGFRYPGPYGDQPALYLDMLELFELHSRSIDQAKMELERNGG